MVQRKKSDFIEDPEVTQKLYTLRGYPLEFYPKMIAGLKRYYSWLKEQRKN